MKSDLQLAKRIKMARIRSGYSQQELAEVLNLSDKAISSYEVGRATPTIHTLREIAEQTNTSLIYFLGEEGSDGSLSHKLGKIEEELAEIKVLLEKRAKSNITYDL